VRREVDIENHEFTDGGLLANFPIKYFDNDTIRDTYFSHMTCKDEKKNKTILLGFGLDQLNPNSYSPSEKGII
jgi:predicted acylesterase/phospholipase RssA